MQLYHCWPELNIQLHCILWIYDPESPLAHESLFLMICLVWARTSLHLQRGPVWDGCNPLYLTIPSTGSGAMNGKEPSSHMAKDMLPNALFSSLTPFGVIAKFWTLQTSGWTSLVHFEALSQETSRQPWALSCKGQRMTFFLLTLWNELSSKTFLREMCLEGDEYHEKTQMGDDGVT